MPSNYAGFQWKNCACMPRQFGKTTYSNTGFSTAFEKDPRCAIFNFGNRPLTISDSRSTFTITSFEATCAFQDELLLTVTGRRDKRIIQSTSVILRYREVKLFHLNWPNISELEFCPTGGKQLPHCDDTDRHVVLVSLTFE
jgi:hypothetical protein